MVFVDMLYSWCLQVFLVPEAGLEPARPNGHMALNHACLPIPALGYEFMEYLHKAGQQVSIKNRSEQNSDLAGARTQDPLLKREMLYQLSYQILNNKI